MSYLPSTDKLFEIFPIIENICQHYIPMISFLLNDAESH